MPELPEVETTLRGIAPHILHQTVSGLTVRQGRLRRPVPPDLAETLIGQTVRECGRRAKYLLIRFDTGVLIIHLGMSGSLRLFRRNPPAPEKHDHIDWQFADGTLLRYRDPRRFGAVLWFSGAAGHHPLLAGLGVEPLDGAFTAEYLHGSLKNRSCSIKAALMDNRTVVGVGNIYANESLFQAALLPSRAANTLDLDDCRRLAKAVTGVLHRAIAAGGSTLRDFANSSGKSGYFQQEYAVYGRNGEACPRCGGEIVRTVLAQRGTFYCPNCQH